jgi:hypothetical protein
MYWEIFSSFERSRRGDGKNTSDQVVNINVRDSRVTVIFVGFGLQDTSESRARPHAAHVDALPVGRRPSSDNVCICSVSREQSVLQRLMRMKQTRGFDRGSTFLSTIQSVMNNCVDFLDLRISRGPAQITGCPRIARGLVSDLVGIREARHQAAAERWVFAVIPW